MGTPRVIEWNDAHVALLKSMHSEGASPSKIAAALGLKSRNAVCGKIDRLGLNGVTKKQRQQAKVEVKPPLLRREMGVGPQVQAINRMREPKASTKGNYSSEGAEAFGIISRIKSKAKAGPIQDNFVPRAAGIVSRRKPLIELLAMECRYPDPEGDPEKDIPHTFCGQRTADGKSYCPAHRELTVGKGTPAERGAAPVSLIGRRAA